jgi:hypothetical protein
MKDYDKYSYTTGPGNLDKVYSEYSFLDEFEMYFIFDSGIKRNKIS